MWCVVKSGDLVRIDPTFFGYDNIPPRWHDAVFVIINVRPDKSRVMVNPYTVCDVLTPDGTMYSFYDYELKDCHVDDEV